MRNVKELVAAAREAPGQLNFSTPGPATPYHLEGELFKARTGIDIVHVPYKGLVQALTALMSADVQMTFSSLPAALPFVKAGKLRALAANDHTRQAALPANAFPAHECGVRQAAAAGNEALRPYIWRTRMIYDFYYNDFAPKE